MNEKEIALRLRQLADEIEPVEPQAPLSALMHATTPESPGDVLALTNGRGYTLQHCLSSMLRRWDEHDPTWNVKLGLARQATGFAIPLEVLHNAIRAEPFLHRRFAAYPQSGYPWALQSHSLHAEIAPRD